MWVVRAILLCHMSCIIAWRVLIIFVVFRNCEFKRPSTIRRGYWGGGCGVWNIFSKFLANILHPRPCTSEPCTFTHTMNKVLKIFSKYFVKHSTPTPCTPTPVQLTPIFLGNIVTIFYEIFCNWQLHLHPCTSHPIIAPLHGRPSILWGDSK